MLYKIVTVIVLSSFEIYVAIGTGMAFKLSPHIICASTLFGGIIGVFVAAFLGEKIKNLVSRFRKPKASTQPAEKKETFLIKLWHRYGVFGIGFIGTFLLGAPASIGVGYGFGVQAKTLIKMCLLAVIIRCVVYSYFFDFIKNLFKGSITLP
jgi:hypothetical protein